MNIAPQPGEIWHLAHSRAPLVWIRQLIDHGIVDVIPLAPDIELADETSIIVGTVAVMVPLRVHIHTSALLAQAGSLNIHEDVAKVIASTRAGHRLEGVKVGLPIFNEDDRRLEYRQAIRALLAQFAPSIWLESDW